MTNLALLYASVPRVDCKRKCQAACGPIMADGPEREAFERATGKFFPDALAVLESKDLSCPLLDLNGGCSVYQHRPLICRLWGVVRRMACPHGCQPERWLTDGEADRLLDATIRIGPQRANAGGLLPTSDSPEEP